MKEYVLREKIVILCTSRSTYSFIILFHEILDLGPPVNAPAHLRSPIFMYNVLLSHLQFWDFFMTNSQNHMNQTYYIYYYAQNY